MTPRPVDPAAPAALPAAEADTLPTSPPGLEPDRLVPALAAWLRAEAAAGRLPFGRQQVADRGLCWWRPDLSIGARVVSHGLPLRAADFKHTEAACAEAERAGRMLVAVFVQPLKRFLNSLALPAPDFWYPYDDAVRMVLGPLVLAGYLVPTQQPGARRGSPLGAWPARVPLPWSNAAQMYVLRGSILAHGLEPRG